MKQTINKRLTLWLLTLVLAAAALPALTAPAQAAEKTPVNVVFGSTTVKGEKEILYGTTRVYCENVTYTLEKDSYYQAYTTWATGDVRIADKVDDKEVRRINTGFFKKVTGNVTLGKNIRSLDYSVFSGGKLQEVTIPEDSNLYRICQYAFRACPNLVRVGVGNTDKLPASVTDIDYYAFYESPAIQSIDLTETKVKSIGECTFTDCTALTSVKLPDGLISIGHSAFKGCTALKALDVPASVQFIGMDTFSYSGITDLKLRCGAVSASGMSIARSLMAMPDGAKVYLPKPSSEKYKDTMQFIYGNSQYTYCGANAKVKVYWLDNNNNTTVPVTEPSAKNNNVVTLSGTDKDKKPVAFSYAKAVAWAVENAITGGTGDGKFSPNATCSRAQAVTFLYRAAGSPKVSGSAEFGDVATNAYYADAVAWAAKNGITGGIGGGLFGSDNDCTRAQIVTFLYRSVK